jgi:transporter family protein
MNRWSAFTWAVLASFCWGFAPLFEKLGLNGKGDPLAGVLIRSAGVLLGATSVAILTPRLIPRLGEFSARHWIYLILGGVVASIVGQLCFYRALKTGQVSQVVPIGASYPVLAFLLGVLFLGEPVTLAKLGGIMLVVTGVYLLR